MKKLATTVKYVILGFFFFGGPRNLGYATEDAQFFKLYKKMPIKFT